MADRVTHFEINVKDPEKSAQFYSDAFGWKVSRWDGPVPYWLVSTGDGIGIDGAITMSQTAEWPKVVNTIRVAAVDETAKLITNNGGKLLTERITVPGVGYLYYAADTEGTTFGIMQMDPTA